MIIRYWSNIMKLKENSAKKIFTKKHDKGSVYFSFVLFIKLKVAMKRMLMKYLLRFGKFMKDSH